MKLLKITLYNLASFEGEQVIDLESEPLKSADLFSIVGETGSGKSTILDAVCLALYGLAPRFYGADNFDYYHTEKPDNNKVLEPDDPRNILRKGAKECRAEVLFLARDGFRYRAMWSCAIARINYTRPVRRLFQLQVDATGNVGEKELEITSGSKARRGHKNVNNETLDRIIGLDYAQFTRTVMLAQNSFANFVKADDTDKAVLLEKLTGTEFYTSIARKIYAFYKEAESDYNRLYEEVKAFAVHRLEEEALQAHTARWQALEEQMKQARTRLTELEAHRQWYVELYRLKEVWQEADGECRKAVQTAESLAPQRRELKRLEEVSEVRECFLQAELLEKEVRNLSMELERLALEVRIQDEKAKQGQEELEEVRNVWLKDKQEWEGWIPKLTEARRLQVEWKTAGEQLAKATAEWELRVKRQASLEQELEQGQALLKECHGRQEQAVRLLQDREEHRRMLEEVGGITERLSRLHQETMRYASEKDQWLQTEQRQLQMGEEMKGVEKTLSKEAQELEQLQQQLGQKQHQLTTVDMEQLQQELDETTRVYKEWEQAGTLWMSAMALRLKRKETQGRLVIGEQQIKELEREAADLQKEQEEIHRLLPGLEEAYRLVSGRTAAELRAALKPEMPCPVCGSLHHPYAEGVEQVLVPVKKQLEQSRNRYMEIQRLLEQIPGGLQFRLSALKGECGALTAQLQELEEHWNKASEEWKSKAVLSAELPSLLPEKEEEEPLSDYYAEYIHRQKEQIVERGKQLRVRQSQYLSWQKELSGGRHQYDVRLKQWQKQQEALHRQQSDWKQCAGKLEQKKLELQDLQQVLEELRASLKEQITYPDWESVFQKDAVRLIAEIKEMAVRYQQAQALIQEMTAKIGEYQVQVTSLEKQQQVLRQEVVQWQAEVVGGKQICAQLQQACQSLLGEDTPETLEEAWKTRLAAGEKCVREKEKQLAATLEVQNRQKGMYQSAEVQLAAKIKASSQVKEELEAFVCHYNEVHCTPSASSLERGEGLTIETLRFYFTSESHWKEVRNRIQLADEEVKLCIGRREAYEKSWQKHWGQGLEKGLMVSEEVAAPDSILVSKAEGIKEAMDLSVGRLQQETLEIQQQLEVWDKERQQVGGVLAAHWKSVEQMQSCQEELDGLKAVYLNWKELNDILGNANGDRFRETAQCFTLHFLVRQANEQLRMLNRRYSLEQVPDSLGIRVIDHDRADEVRNISSLSGGETFLVSLALALGLSSLSSRNIPMGNLFVDEGFGTLDSNSLNLVIDALSNLQSMQGKKVGVISHTAEMKERIRTQIQVVKVGSGGKSVLKVV